MAAAVSPAFYFPCVVARKALGHFRSGFDPLAVSFLKSNLQTFCV